MTQPNPFSERLRALAAERTFSQAEIARRSQMSRPSVNRLFKGRAPTIEQLQALAAVFELPVGELAGDSDATHVLAQASIGPTEEEHRLALEELAKAKAELLQAKAELEAEQGRRKEAVAARRVTEKANEQMSAELSRSREAEQQLRGQLEEAQGLAEEWAETSQSQEAHINALEKTKAVLARDYAAAFSQLQQVQKVNEAFAVECDRLHQSNRALALRENAKIDPGAALLTGLLGLTLGGALGVASKGK